MARNSVAIVGGAANTIFSLIAQAGDQELRRPQGQAHRPVAAGRHHLDRQPHAAGKARPQGSRLSHQGAGRHADPRRMPDATANATPCRSASPTTSCFTQKGYPKLGDSLEVIPVLQFNVIAARRDWADGQQGRRCRASPAPSAPPTSSCATRPTATRSTQIIAETTGAPPEVARADARVLSTSPTAA